MHNRGIKTYWVKNFKTTGYFPSFSRKSSPVSLKSKKIKLLPKIKRETAICPYKLSLIPTLKRLSTASTASKTPPVNTPVKTNVRKKFTKRFLLYCQKFISKYFLRIKATKETSKCERMQTGISKKA